MASMEEKSNTQIEKNPEIYTQNKNTSETNLSDLKSETLSSSSNTNSSYPSFSKLLEGVVMAANSALSSDPSVKTADFQVIFIFIFVGVLDFIVFFIFFLHLILNFGFLLIMNYMCLLLFLFWYYV